MFKPSDPGQLREAKALADYMSVTAQALGGTCTGIIYLHHIHSYTQSTYILLNILYNARTGEHGVGVGKKGHLRAEMGPGTMKVGLYTGVHIFCTRLIIMLYGTYYGVCICLYLCIYTPNKMCP